jgi:ribonuclease G
MNRLAITRILHRQRSFTAYLILDEKRQIVDLQVFEPEEQTLLDNIYVAYVEKIVPNIQAAFVRIGDGQKCYLPFSELKSPIFCKKQSQTKPICEGDELIVQVIRDAVKTKEPVVSTKLTIHGHYALLTSDNTVIGVSKKLSNDRAGHLLSLAQSCCLLPQADETTPAQDDLLAQDAGPGYGIVIRTSARDAADDEITADIVSLQAIFRRITTTGVHSSSGTLLHRNMPGYLARLKAEDPDRLDRIYTDQRDLYDEIAAYLPKLKESGLLRFYDDPQVSLSTLYHLRGNMEQLLGSKVWLPSGANIIIEQLETLTVIDVNSGKNISRKPEFLFSVNLEAAREIARQLRLRNISGIIIVDFINLSSDEQQRELVSVIRQELKKDVVPAQFVDLTKLGLVEITRKKTYKSLREIMG